MRYYWEKGCLLIVKNVGARDCSVRLYMSSNIFLDTGVFYLLSWWVEVYLKIFVVNEDELISIELRLLRFQQHII